MFADFEPSENNEEFLDDYRQKLSASASDAFEERKSEINRSKNVFVGTVSGIALAAVVGWFVLSPQYASETNVEIPVVRRPQSAIKVQPSEPGGMEIQNQDKSVYDIIEKKQDKAPVVENLLPPPEVPQLPIITADTTPTEPVKVGDAKIVEKAEAIIQEAEQKKTTAEPIKVATPAAVVAAAEQAAPVKETTIKEASLAPQKIVEEKSVPAPTAVKVETIKIPATPATVEKPVVGGDWQVQLMSSTNRAAVDSAWSGLVKKYPVLAGQSREVETADLGAKGTYYRLKAGAFADRSGADKLCNDIKALGGTCLVKKK